MELLVIRHALPVRRETDDGSAADPELSELGHRQADALAEWLAEDGIDAIYVSPMQRARQTAAPLEAATGLTATVEEDVAEFDRDHNSYVPMEQLKVIDYEAWRTVMETGVMPGAGDPEEFHGVVVDALDAIVARHSGDKVAVVCHGGVINAWASHVLGLGPTMFFDPRYTSVNRFICSSKGHRTLYSLNELAHLRGLPTPAEVFASGA